MSQVWEWIAGHADNLLKLVQPALAVVLALVGYRWWHRQQGTGKRADAAMKLLADIQHGTELLDMWIEHLTSTMHPEHDASRERLSRAGVTEMETVLGELSASTRYARVHLPTAEQLALPVHTLYHYTRPLAERLIQSFDGELLSRAEHINISAKLADYSIRAREARAEAERVLGPIARFQRR
jgi:hypothetical protein